MVKVAVSFLVLWAMILGIVFTDGGSADANLPSSEALSRAKSSGVLPPVLDLQRESQSE